jgi:hypothetical protein
MKPQKIMPIKESLDEFTQIASNLWFAQGYMTPSEILEVQTIALRMQTLKTEAFEKHLIRDAK